MPWRRTFMEDAIVFFSKAPLFKDHLQWWWEREGRTLRERWSMEGDERGMWKETKEVLKIHGLYGMDSIRVSSQIPNSYFIHDRLFLKRPVQAYRKKTKKNKKREQVFNPYQLICMLLGPWIDHLTVEGFSCMIRGLLLYVRNFLERVTKLFLRMASDPGFFVLESVYGRWHGLRSMLADR